MKYVNIKWKVRLLSHVRLFVILQARILEWVAFPFSRKHKAIEQN